MKRRILVLTGSYHPDVGGGELLNAWHARLLREAGYDVEVLIARDGSGGGIDPFGTPFELGARRSIAGFNALQTAPIETAIESFSPDAIYLTGPQPHDFYARRIAARRGIPCALLYHADLRSDRWISRAATALYARLVARRLDRVFVTTHAYRDRLLARGVPQPKVAYVGMGVDVDAFAPRVDYEERAVKQLLFVGRLDSNHTYKRLDLLLDAMRLLVERGRAIALTVVGDGDRREFFENVARENGIANEVRFRGQIDFESLRAAYREADLFVLPSPTEAEGFGLVLLEALASGCPAVTGRLAGGSEAVMASGCGSAWEGSDSVALANAIDAVLRDPRSRAGIARAAADYARTHHSWNAVRERLDDGFSRLISAGLSSQLARKADADA